MLTSFFKKEIPNFSRYLVCIDYDRTLINGNSYSFLESLEISPGQVSSSVVHTLIKIYGLKNPDYMRDIIRHTLNTGNCVAIVSFNLYPEIIKLTLLSMGLTDHEVNQILVKSFSLSVTDELFSGKQAHIEAAISHFNINEDSRVLLVDDDFNNIEIAKRKGHRTVLVPRNETRESAMYGSGAPMAPKYIRNIFENIAELSLFDFSQSYLPSFRERVTLQDDVLDDFNAIAVQRKQISELVERCTIL